MNFQTPETQKSEDRPITFVMDDDSAGTSDELTMLIRPEDLSIGFPSRMSVNQTLGGGWADNFGEGLEEGTFSGTLGWRATNFDTGGTERLASMKAFTYTDWHLRRERAIAKGDDPNKVKLILVDTLNSYARIIAPRVFELKRSRSRPLLAQYRFSFVVLSKDLTGATLSATNDSGGFLGSILGTAGSWLDSLSSSINNITSYVRTAYTWIDKNIVKPVQGFVAKTQGLLNSVRGFVAAGVGIAKQVVGVAQMATKAALNIFRSASMVIGLPAMAKGLLMSIAGEFSNCFCLMKNAVRSLSSYEDFTTAFGASNCSSTTFGRGISSYSGALTNTFSSVMATNTSVVSVTQAASAGLSKLANVDLVKDTLPSSTISSALGSINSGLKLLS